MTSTFDNSGFLIKLNATGMRGILIFHIWKLMSWENSDLIWKGKSSYSYFLMGTTGEKINSKNFFIWGKNGFPAV